MPPYTAMMIMKPSSTMINIKGSLSSITNKIISEHNGIIKDINNSGLRTLPYQMKGDKIGERFTSGNYLSITFISSPSSINDIKNFISSNSEIIRSNIYRSDELSLPSIKQKSVMKLVSSSATSSSATDSVKVKSKDEIIRDAVFASRDGSVLLLKKDSISKSN